MNKQEILDVITQVVRKNFDNDAIVLTQNSKFEDVEGWDSLEQINMLSTLEGLLEIKFDIDDVVKMEDVAAMIEVIEEKKQ